jgi:hypothetical protein
MFFFINIVNGLGTVETGNNSYNNGLSAEATDVDSDSLQSERDGGAHPDFTNLVQVIGRELSLGPQHFEVKHVVRKAMDMVVARLFFENGFPSLASRAIWNCRSLIKACTSIEQSTGSHAQERYHQLLQRLKNDAKYVKILSRLVSVHQFEKSYVNLFFKLDARLPIMRGNMKIIAVMHATTAYDLARAGKDTVVDLLKDMRYIYPPSVNVRDVYSY